MFAYRKLILLALLLLNACNLAEAQPTIVIVPHGQDVPAALSNTLPGVQLIADTTNQTVATPTPTIQPVSQVFEDTLDPILLLASFYNAINLKDYQRAYNYWGILPGDVSLAQFAQGYTDTDAVQGIVGLPVITDGAAGSIYAVMRTALIATRTDGSQQVFVACYVARMSNVPVGDSAEPDPNWSLYSGSAVAAAGPVSPELVDEGCVGTVYEGDYLEPDLTTTIPSPR